MSHCLRCLQEIESSVVGDPTRAKECDKTPVCQNSEKRQKETDGKRLKPESKVKEKVTVVVVVTSDNGALGREAVKH